MSKKPEQYRAFLVRMWRSDAYTPWRAAVKLVATGEELNFAGIGELWAFLAEQTAEPPLDAGAPDHPPG